MVLIVKAPKIFTGKTQSEELADDFKAETKMMLEKAALENGCDVEDLKFSVNNAGIVNIRSITPEERDNMESERVKKNRINKLLDLKGLPRV